MLLEFFLGANSKKGFVSLYDTKNTERADDIYIIKGGPGTGKSTLMKRLSCKKSELTELLYCSSDPSSLDGVILHDEKRIEIYDGTAPHIIEPRYPGAVEHYVDISKCWNTKKLKENRSEIIRLTNENKKCFEQAYNYTKSAGLCAEHILSTVITKVDIDKLNRKGTMLAKKYIKSKGSGGNEYKRFLSSISPNGVILLEKSVFACEIIIKLNDLYNLSPFILAPILKHALLSKYDVFSCFCPLNPKKLEHIIIPELKLCFTTADVSAQKTVNFALPKEFKAECKFYKSCAEIFIEGAVKHLLSAKQIHDKLESLYTKNVDFKKMNKIYSDIT